MAAFGLLLVFALLWQHLCKLVLIVYTAHSASLLSLTPSSFVVDKWLTKEREGEQKAGGGRMAGNWKLICMLHSLRRHTQLNTQLSSSCSSSAFFWPSFLLFLLAFHFIIALSSHCSHIYLRISIAHGTAHSSVALFNCTCIILLKIQL